MLFPIQIPPRSRRTLLATGVASLLLSIPVVADAGDITYSQGFPDSSAHISAVDVSTSPALQENTQTFDKQDLQENAASLKKTVTDQLHNAGLWQAQGGDTLKLVITSLTPNRPTMAQMNADPSLSYQSFGLGGAGLSGTLVDPSGNLLGSFRYAWQQNWIANAEGVGTWFGANQAYRRFAEGLQQDLSPHQSSH